MTVYFTVNITKPVRLVFNLSDPTLKEAIMAEIDDLSNELKQALAEKDARDRVDFDEMKRRDDEKAQNIAALQAAITDLEAQVAAGAQVAPETLQNFRDVLNAIKTSDLDPNFPPVENPPAENPPTEPTP